MATTELSLTTTDSSRQDDKEPSFGHALIRWEHYTQWPLALLALAFLGLYAYEVIGELSGTLLLWVENAISVIWLIFFIDYVVRLAITNNRWAWMKANVLDLLSVALPVMRPLRLLRIVALIRVLQRTTGERIRDQIVTYTVSTTILLVFVSSLAILEAERNAANSTIQNFHDALWWSVVTITTVGYGDYTPVTSTGRLITLALMIGGMALIGIITATLASWITERASSENERIEAGTQQQITQLQSTLATLHSEISALRAQLNDANMPAPEITKHES